MASQSALLGELDFGVGHPGGAEPVATIATIPALTDAPLAFSVIAQVRFPVDDLGFKQNAALIFDCHSPTDFKFVSIHAGVGRWRIGQRTPERWNFLVTYQQERPMLKDKDMFVTVQVRGAQVTVLADGIAPVTHQFDAPVNGGLLGLGSKRATVMFGELAVAPLVSKQALEFVELTNSASDPIDLAGWRLAALTGRSRRAWPSAAANRWSW